VQDFFPIWKHGPHPDCLADRAGFDRALEFCCTADRLAVNGGDALRIVEAEVPSGPTNSVDVRDYPGLLDDEAGEGTGAPGQARSGAIRKAATATRKEVMSATD
jgi:hypothetical protein